MSHDDAFAVAQIMRRIHGSNAFAFVCRQLEDCLSRGPGDPAVSAWLAVADVMRNDVTTDDTLSTAFYGGIAQEHAPHTN